MKALILLAEALVVLLSGAAGWTLCYGLALTAGRHEPIYSIVGGGAGVLLTFKVLGRMRRRP
jgi:hypothetical protein